MSKDSIYDLLQALSFKITQLNTNQQSLVTSVQDLTQQVQHLLHDNKGVKTLGAGLYQAKPGTPYGELNKEEQALSYIDKIQTIFVYRYRTGCGLAESTEVVEAWMNANPNPNPKGETTHPTDP